MALTVNRSPPTVGVPSSHLGHIHASFVVNGSETGYVSLGVPLVYLCHKFNSTITPTAEGQAVACAPVTQRAQVRSPVGTSFLGEFFFGVFAYL